MVEYINGCVGCERCIHCGRDEYSEVLSCDNCGTTNSSGFYRYEDQDLCYLCAQEVVEDPDKDLVKVVVGNDR